MQINQTSIESAYVKQDAAQASGTTLNTVDDANAVEEGTEPAESPSTIVTLSNGTPAAPLTYEFGNGPGKPPP